MNALALFGNSNRSGRLDALRLGNRVAGAQRGGDPRQMGDIEHFEIDLERAEIFVSLDHFQGDDIGTAGREDARYLGKRAGPVIQNHAQAADRAGRCLSP